MPTPLARAAAERRLPRPGCRVQGHGAGTAGRWALKQGGSGPLMATWPPSRVTAQPGSTSTLCGPPAAERVLAQGTQVAWPPCSVVPGHCPAPKADLLKPERRPAPDPLAWTSVPGARPAQGHGIMMESKLHFSELFDGRPRRVREAGARGLSLPCLQASSILASLPRGPALPRASLAWRLSPAAPGIGAGPRLAGEALEPPAPAAFLFPCCVSDSLCGHQIKAGKWPIFYGITCHHCADPEDVSTL